MMSSFLSGSFITAGRTYAPNLPISACRLPGTRATSVDLHSARCEDSPMLRRLFSITSVALLAFALATCGSEEKKEKKGEADKGKQAASEAKAGPATPGEPGGAPMKGLFGGKFQGVLGGLGSGAISKIDLGGAFSKNLPTMAPAVAPGGQALKDPGTSKALWAYCPADAALGIVVADGTVEKVSSALEDLQRLLRMRPGGADVIEAIRKETAGDADFDFWDPKAWSQKAGLDVSKGMAIYVSVDGNALAVMPIVNADAFRKAVKDDDGDLGPEHCVTHGGRYVCSEKLDYAKAALAPHDSPLAQRAAGLPGWLRGDVELVALLSAFPDAAEGLEKLSPALTDINTVAIAARLDNGALTVRGWLEGKRGGPVGAAFAALPPASLQGLSSGAVNWFHLRFPLAFVLDTAGAPAAMPIPNSGGLDFRRDVLNNLTGEMVAYSRGNFFLAEHIALGLKEPAPTAKVVDFMCQMVKMQGMLGSVKAGPGTCQGEVDLGALLSQVEEVAPFVQGMPKIPVWLAVRGKTLELQVGKVAPPGNKAADNAGNAVGAEMLTGNWNAVQWGMGFDPLAIAPPVLTGRFDKLVLATMDADALKGINMFRWLYDHIYDAGVALALREDGIYATVQITTFAGDPGDAYRAHEDAVMRLLDRDYKGYHKAVAEIAAKHPNTLAGRHAELVTKGVPMLGQLGALGAFAWAAMIQQVKRDAPAQSGAAPATPPAKMPEPARAMPKKAPGKKAMRE